MAERDSYGRIDGVRVFAAMAHSRPGNLEAIGGEISQWCRANPGLEIIDVVVKLRGGEGFIWKTITMFYRFRPGVTAEIAIIPHAHPDGDEPPSWLLQGQDAPADAGADADVDADDGAIDLPPDAPPPDASLPDALPPDEPRP